MIGRQVKMTENAVQKVTNQTDLVNQQLSEQTQQIQAGVLRGKLLGQVLRDAKAVSTIEPDTVASGEDTGREGFFVQQTVSDQKGCQNDEIDKNCPEIQTNDLQTEKP